MGKVISLLLCVVAGGFDLFAYTRVEQTAVACYLIDGIRRGPDVMDALQVESDQEVVVQFPTYESLFLTEIPDGVIGHGWTVEEKRDAFEMFLMDIPRLATTNEVDELTIRGEVGLSFCDERGGMCGYVAATNLLATDCVPCEGTAVDVFKKHYSASFEMNDFVELVITNRPTSSCIEYISSFYAGDLARSLNERNRDLVVEGSKMLLRNRCGGSASRQLDKLLTRIWSEYEISSNRLELAVWTLQDLIEHPRLYDGSIRQYFAPITNRLLNVSSPLPEVEALRSM